MGPSWLNGPRLPFVMVQACACCPAHGSCSGTALAYCGRLVELDCWRLARRWLTSWLGMMRVPLMTGVACGVSVTVGPRVETVGKFAPCDHGRAFGERVRLLLDGLRVPFGCSAVEVHVHGGGASVLPLVRLRVELAVGVHDAEDDACHVLSLGGSTSAPERGCLRRCWWS